MKKSRLSVGETAPEPLPLRSEAEIVASWTSDSPVVSVVCLSYNHADFIGDAILGFLGQQTTFPFEVIIRDDASTDNTAEIMREYQTKYPRIIRCIYGAENQYRTERGLSSMSRVARGEFLAYCEGDDYWISPIKLETQINSLRQRTDCVVSHHQAVVVENDQVVSKEKLPEKNQRDFGSEELQKGAWLLTLSLVYRNILIPSHPKAHRFVNGDKYLTSRLGDHGGAVFETDLTGAVYRRHGSGVWSSLDDTDRRMTQATSFYYVAAQYFEEGRRDLGAYWLEKAVKEIRRAFESER